MPGIQWLTYQQQSFRSTKVFAFQSFWAHLNQKPNSHPSVGLISTWYYKPKICKPVFGISKFLQAILIASQRSTCLAVQVYCRPLFNSDLLQIPIFEPNTGSSFSNQILLPRSLFFFLVCMSFLPHLPSLELHRFGSMPGSVCVRLHLKFPRWPAEWTLYSYIYIRKQW